MIPTDCPYGDDPRMCEYCSLKDTCDHKCCPKTTVAWGNITGLLTGQTDLTAELDKRQTEAETKITESAATLQAAIDTVEAKVGTNTTNIAANTTNISDLNTKHNELQTTLENDYYKGETVDTKLSDLSDTLSQDIATAQSSADTAQATATAAQSAVDALETTVNKHGVTLQELPFNYPHFIRTNFVLKEGESCMLVQLPIGLERELINTLKSYVDRMPEEGWWETTPYLNTYILPIYDIGEILNFDKTRHHIQHFQAWQVRCYDIVRSAELTPSVSTIISEPCIEIEFGEDLKTLYAERLGLPCVAMRITEESVANRVWFFVDSKGNIAAKKGFQDEA